MTTAKHFFAGALLLVSLFVFTNCSEDDSPGSGDDLTGQASFEITDGPADDANIQGAFVTVAAVKVDGKPLAIFQASKQ